MAHTTTPNHPGPEHPRPAADPPQRAFPAAAVTDPAQPTGRTATLRRLAAALIALLTFAPALAVVAASPASAHPQTKTVQRCAYDPFAGNQCWTETVTVAHRHRPTSLPKCPTGTTGVYPNCTRPDTPAEAENQNNDGDGNDRDPSDQKNINNARDQNQNTGNQDDSSDSQSSNSDSDGSGSPGSNDDQSGDNGNSQNNGDTDTPGNQNADGQDGNPDQNNGDSGANQGDGAGPDGSDDSNEPEDAEPDSSDTTQNPCEPWPACNQSSDPKPTTTTTCVAPGRGPGHKHDGHDCHANTQGHTHSDDSDGEDDADDGNENGGSGGSAYGLANALGKVLNWYDANKDTLADPPQALTDAVKSQATRDAAKAVARVGLDFMENNLELFGGLTIAQQKALSRLFLDAPPEAQVVITNVACGSLAIIPGVGGYLAGGCGIVVGVSAIHDDKVRPWLRPFSEILLPEENDDTPGDTDGDGGTDTTDPQPGADDSGDAPAATEPPKVTAEERSRAFLQMRRGEITYEQYREIRDRYRCQTTGQACNQ